MNAIIDAALSHARTVITGLVLLLMCAALVAALVIVPRVL